MFPLKGKVAMVEKYMWIHGKSYKIPKAYDPSGIGDYAIEFVDNAFTKTFNIPAYYCHFLKTIPDLSLIGRDTDATLILSAKDSSVAISADKADSVGKAVFKFHNLLFNTRTQLKPKQFIALPILSDEIKNNFHRFKDEILKLNLPGVEESIFMREEKLHFTITVLSLMDDHEIEAGKEALETCKTKVILPFIEKHKPLKLVVEGIDTMQTNHSKVRVLYAKSKIVGETYEFNLQILLDKILVHFQQFGLDKEFRDSVKIHATLMNTKYRVNNSKKTKKFHGSNWTPFCATEIFSKYKDFYFGQSDLNRFTLSLMSNSGEDGYYESVSAIKV